MKHLALALAACLPPTAGAEISDSAVLLATLGPSVVTLAAAPSPPLVRYCPDNTCVELRGKGDQDALNDFALAYLVFASGYTHLKTFVQSPAANRANAIVAKSVAACPAGDKATRISCVLLNMVSRHSIDAVVVRYDEGQVARAPINLTAELAPEALERLWQWRKEQWQPQ
jgi:hypothetical protein